MVSHEEVTRLIMKYEAKIGVIDSTNRAEKHHPECDERTKEVLKQVIADLKRMRDHK